MPGLSERQTPPLELVPAGEGQQRLHLVRGRVPGLPAAPTPSPVDAALALQILHARSRVPYHLQQSLHPQAGSLCPEEGQEVAPWEWAVGTELDEPSGGRRRRGDLAQRHTPALKVSSLCSPCTSSMTM